MEAYVVSAFRSPVGKAKKGGFKYFRSDDLAVKVIQHLAENVPGLDPNVIDDIIVGCANPEGEQGLQMGRQIALKALGIEVPGLIVNRYCASGLETIAIATAKIRAGMGECYIAGGTETMSLIPMEGYRFAPNYEVANDHPDYLVGMGLTAEAVAKKFDISREAQDEFAYKSHMKAINAIDKGLFKDEIVPIEVTNVTVKDGKRSEETYTVDTDEGIRRSTTVEGLSKLRPVFVNKGSVTAGNSSQTSDGAAFVLVMSERMVKELNLTPIARLVSCTSAGVEPILMGIGPVKAIPKALKLANLTLNDIDQIELNEAFASQALAVIKKAGLNPDIVNVNGGAIALGHPLGCTGAKLSTQLFSEMRRRNQKYGMVTACVGGGQGIAGVWELLS